MTSFTKFSQGSLYQALCFALLLGERGMFYPVKCSEMICDSFFCERETPPIERKQAPVITLPLHEVYASNTQLLSNVDLFLCPRGHLTHSFLACDTTSDCGRKHNVQRCDLSMITANRSSLTGTGPVSVEKLVFVEMFACHATEERIPYTLVCDFRQDCRDDSDEIYCEHYKSNSSSGSDFRCKNGQMVSEENVCDVKDDCLDGSDESDCIEHAYYEYTAFHRKAPPVIIHFNGPGTFREEALDPSEPTCPDTHFKCYGEQPYCFPVFLKCNGMKDCPGGEDELGCDDVNCPGYYKCRSSAVCLHVDYVCDGWPHCPERDDEQLCNFPCPAVCYCQGLAFVCHKDFPVGEYHDLRYLDATGSGINPENVSIQFYLIYLKMASCGLTTWPGITFYNLQQLDLSYNNLSVFYIPHLVSLDKLRFLSLKGNPLTKFWEVTNDSIFHTSVVALDLSFTDIRSIDSASLKPFPNLMQLNLSHNMLKVIGGEGFSPFKNLQEIDLRGCCLRHFPDNVFKELKKLHTIYASNYRLCCREFLPFGFDSEQCFSSQDELSSCRHLLNASSHRVYLWGIGLLSILGNAFSIIFTPFVYHRKRAPHSVLWVNLNVANLLMGVFSLILSVANEVFSGTYIEVENLWTNSVTCKMAGLLSLVSYNVSIAMLCLITVDRLVMLRCPRSKISFNECSVTIVTVLVWGLGTVLAVVPLLPEHWDSFRQGGICFPLVVPEHHLQFHLILCSSVVSVLIATGQGIVFLASRSVSTTISRITDLPEDVKIARRLTTIVVSDLLCWFAFGSFRLFVSRNTPFYDTINVTMTLYLLPLSAALNPLLYVYNVFIEQKQRSSEERVAMILKAGNKLAPQH